MGRRRGARVLPVGRGRFAVRSPATPCCASTRSDSRRSLPRRRCSTNCWGSSTATGSRSRCRGAAARRAREQRARAPACNRNARRDRADRPVHDRDRGRMADGRRPSHHRLRALRAALARLFLARRAAYAPRRCLQSARSTTRVSRLRSSGPPGARSGSRLASPWPSCGGGSRRTSRGLLTPDTGRQGRRSPCSDSQPAEPLEGERRLCQWAYRQSHQHERIVVAGDAVEVHDATPAATVDEHPLAVTAHADRHRLHRGAAVGRPVARDVVEMPAPQAIRAVVAVRRSRRVGRHVEPAVSTSECVRATAPDTSALIARQGVTSTRSALGDEEASRSGRTQPGRRDLVCSVAALIYAPAAIVPNAAAGGRLAPCRPAARRRGT